MEDPNWPWDFFAALGAIGATAVAWLQIGSVKRQQRGWETLRACDRYDSDPVLNSALASLEAARKGVGINKDVVLDACKLLNYFEGLAIGVEQRLYDQRIIRDHLETIMREHVDELLSPNMRQALGFPADNFNILEQLLAKWANNRPWYRAGLF